MKDRIVVPAHHDPGLAPRDAVDQKVEHPPAVRPPVHEVAEMHHGSRHIPRRLPVFPDLLMRSGQHVPLAVHIADGVNAVHRSEPSSSDPVQTTGPDHATSNSRGDTDWNRPVAQSFWITGSGIGSST